MYVEKYGTDFLIPCRNQPSQRAAVLANQPSITSSMLSDNEVRNLAFNKPTIDFSHKNGVFNGMINFFIYLYLQTAHLYSDPETHLVKLAKIFRRGAMEEAMISQSLRITEKFCHLKDAESLAYLSPSAKVMDPRLDALKDASIKNGIYKVCLYAMGEEAKGHAMVLIKVSDDLAYIFDPNHGLIRRKGESLKEKLFALFKEHLKRVDMSSQKKVSVVLEKFSMKEGDPVIKPFSWEDIFLNFENAKDSVQDQFRVVYDLSMFPRENTIIQD